MSEGITQSQVIEKMMGGTRTDDQIMRDGARATISQIDKLRNVLRQAEQCCQHVIATGRERHDDAKVWKRVEKAADKLLDGML
ncbi:hypothetical protein [Sphingomonas sp. 1P08PE]|uniref:hypothetical protein n=1 Tax=Sphingomonas sp. 1P08PE TaxID=554122 RepID=UPI0039A1516C